MAGVPPCIEVHETEMALCVKGQVEGRQVQSWSIVEEYTTLTATVLRCPLLSTLLKVYTKLESDRF